MVCAIVHVKIKKCLFFQSTGNILNFCEVGLKISGIVPITVSSAIHYPNYLVTSVVLAVTERHLVIFVGTSTGIIKKVCTLGF